MDSTKPPPAPNPCYNRKQGNRSVHSRRAKAEDLQKASLAQKEEKILTFDCSVRPKDELTNWISHNQPSKTKRSNKIGYLMVLSNRCSKKKFIHSSKDLEENHSELISEWEQLTQDPTAEVTYSTIMQLGKKHNALGGKWLFSVRRGQDDVDSIWTSLASAMAKEDKTLPYLAVKITSVNDIDDGSLQPTRDHMISIYTEDFTNEDNVFEVEKMLRQVSKKVLTYKPDIFTVLGIYRNNKYRLKPVIYKSEWHPDSGTSVIDSLLDMEWRYRGGSGDLRMDRKTDKEKERPRLAKTAIQDLEALIDSAIDRNLSSKTSKSGAKESKGANDINENLEGIVDRMSGVQIGKDNITEDQQGKDSEEGGTNSVEVGKVKTMEDMEKNIFQTIEQSLAKEAAAKKPDVN